MTKAQEVLDLIALADSMARHCEIYKAKDGQWYLELADREHGDVQDSTTYGPFKDEQEAGAELSFHSNPGGLFTDKSGKRPVPKKSPNGRPVQKPSGSGTGWGYR